MAQNVVKVHREHLESHRFIQRYNSGYEYLRKELDIPESEIADGYREMEVQQMYRIHSSEPRQFMILQKNPNLKHSWVSDTPHGPHTHLSGWDGDILKRNIDHSRTTVAGYLKDGGGGRLQIILQALADELGEENFGFDSPLERQDLSEYFRTSVNDAYSNDVDSPVIGSNEGFFGDFAYSNVMKFQGPGEKVSPKTDDYEWLQNEIAAINPQMILSLGNTAKHSLKEIGFERTDYSGPFHQDEGKVYTYNGPDPRLEGTRALRLYHLGARKSHSALEEIINSSIQAVESCSGFN